MQDLSFKQSDVGTIGVELELQLINIKDGRLYPRAEMLLNSVKDTIYEKRVKPEITQSMIEINSSIHKTPKAIYDELKKIKACLFKVAKPLGITFCGGGTHPFEKWSDQKITPDERYKHFFKQFGFLCQQATVFGQHVHIGCDNPDDTIYLTHALGRYVPQLIALSASSPFYEAVNTCFCSTRNTIFNSLPTNGHMPGMTCWKDFKAFFFKMKRAGILESMKDMHWDIRPKPEFGTVEVRILDTPLSLKKAVAVAAYIQALAIFLLEKRPVNLTKELYDLYNYNRFLANRFGIKGMFIHHENLDNHCIRDDIKKTLDDISKYIQYPGAEDFIAGIEKQVSDNAGDSHYLSAFYEKHQSLPDVVFEQCRLWRMSIEDG